MHLSNPKPGAVVGTYPPIMYSSIYFIYLTPTLCLTSRVHPLHSSLQYKFIVQDLVSVNRFETPWLVFTGHRPIYVDSPMESDFEQRKLAHDMNVKLEG